MGSHYSQDETATAGRPLEAGPPRPQEMVRRLSFDRSHLVGIALMTLVPVLALFGVFGESVDTVRMAGGGIEAEVRYPTRFRYKMIDTIDVSVKNIGEQPASAVTVQFDQQYMSRFSTVQFTPQVKEVTEKAYIVELADIMPGEVRRISVDVQAEDYGRHAGTVVVSTQNGAVAEASLSTIVFP